MFHYCFVEVAVVFRLSKFQFTWNASLVTANLIGGGETGNRLYSVKGCSFLTLNWSCCVHTFFVNVAQ